jgi:hypothetical protein
VLNSLGGGVYLAHLPPLHPAERGRKPANKSPLHRMKRGFRGEVNRLTTHDFVYRIANQLYHANPISSPIQAGAVRHEHQQPTPRRNPLRQKRLAP